ncbi:hypothetical protein PPERSA_10681 [Pseudocohnilembus persalinus]|uniref:Uncharacterized protein n=1 Tax=Pseudocohnilembus persalinus TaxID=266149 RepID=A0A0V0QDD1_PSEPJ|nr:hypothetical protein PPERSA_10681 [Pseudocohnilembus persalinus]|eukprot:KRX00182.1 hypothetical protein PPERSA_10681 [Pseudocohnilembus persalinus]
MGLKKKYQEQLNENHIIKAKHQSLVKEYDKLQKLIDEIENHLVNKNENKQKLTEEKYGNDQKEKRALQEELNKTRQIVEDQKQKIEILNSQQGNTTKNAKKQQKTEIPSINSKKDDNQIYKRQMMQNNFIDEANNSLIIPKSKQGQLQIFPVVKKQDIQALALELKMRLRSKKLTADNVLDWFVFNKNIRKKEVISIREILYKIKEDPFCIQDSRQALLLARYLVEDNKEDKIIFDEEMAVNLPTVRSRFRYLIGEFKLFSAQEDQYLHKILTQIVSKHRENIQSYLDQNAKHVQQTGKEDLYKENILLKQNMMNVKQENFEVKQKIQSLAKENDKLKKLIGDVENYVLNKKGNYNENEVKQNLQITNLKRKYNENKEYTEQLQNEILEIKKTVKYNEITELQTQIKASIQENYRLRTLLDKANSQIDSLKNQKQNEFQEKQEDKNEIYFHLIQENSEQKQTIKFLEDEIFRLQTFVKEENKKKQKKNQKLEDKTKQILEQKQTIEKQHGQIVNLQEEKLALFRKSKQNEDLQDKIKDLIGSKDYISSPHSIQPPDNIIQNGVQQKVVTKEQIQIICKNIKVKLKSKRISLSQASEYRAILNVKLKRGTSIVQISDRGQQRRFYNFRLIQST